MLNDFYKAAIESIYLPLASLNSRADPEALTYAEGMLDGKASRIHAA
jgi:hypothetical protein